MNKFPLTKALLASAAVLALSLSAIAKSVEETTTHQLPSEGITSLSVETINGSVTCEAWDKDEIQITYTKKSRGGSEEVAQKHLDLVKVLIENKDGQLVVATKHPKKGGGFWKWITGNNSNVSVAYQIQIPASLNVSMDSVNGTITAKGIAGKLNAGTVNGSITASDLAGPAQGDTVNGSIRCSFVEAISSENMSFSTVNGSVRIALPENSGFEIKASTVNGSIKTDFELTEVFTQKKRHLHAIAGEGGPKLSFDTVNGSVKVQKL